jgi:hypothetical protein
MTKHDCCVIGAGTFGTKLAHHLKQHGRDVIATHHDPNHLDQLHLRETATDNTHASNQSHITCLTVRPGQVPATSDELDEPGVLANYTPATFTQYNPIHVASTPPTDNTLHYIGYDDTSTTQKHTSLFEDIIGATANHIEQVDNHAETLARMAQLYATTLAYTNKLSLSDIQQDAFLALTSDAAQTTTSLDALLAEAATKDGFTATTLETTQAIIELQQRQKTKLKEVLDDI